MCARLQRWIAKRVAAAPATRPMQRYVAIDRDASPGRDGDCRPITDVDADVATTASVGMDAVLTVMARSDAKLGLIFLDMKRAADDLSLLV